ncbi:sensor histidine kinase [Amycolatopsis anabasis]|uniref:sensor histidine kinase n=1 Tax=Amycolatopsis anabasis TaxID=1840409 RepID=UPI00131AC964|nr:sensor domain-containing protein [Amycolatopsis anabasis]
MTTGESRAGSTQRTWAALGGVATLRGAALAALALVEVVLFVILVSAGSLVGVGIGLFLLPPVVLAVRGLANLQRTLAGDWSGVRIPVPYVAELEGARPLQRCHRLLGDRATWRDALWLLVDSTVGLVLTFAPLALMLHGLRGILMPFLLQSSPDDEWLGNWYVVLPVSGPATAWAALVLGVAHFPLALWLAPRLLRWHARLAAALLAPTENTRLTHRVQHLTETRDDAVGSQAGELRRIERNLHDGAQARLVAMGMTLDAAVRIMEKHPEAAKSLLQEAKTNSARALQELRDLVRGIQPPVLVDRGIADAIRTLAMENPLQIETTIDLPGRPSPAVESAAYFTVSEVLNNAVKHSGADSGSIEVRHADGRLLINVSDYGRGGADPSRGTGLRGIERRLAPLDGFITVLSPLGGPTMVAIEIPCDFIT